MGATRSPAWLLGGIALALAATPVSAEEFWGAYAAIGGGWGRVNDVTYNLATAFNPSHPATFNDGYLADLKAGWRFGGPRVELELAYRNNEVDSFGPSGSVGPGAGSLNATTLMANAFYDFDTGTRVTPYVGVGIGGADVKADDIRRDIPSSSCCTGIVSGGSTGWAWQAIAGVAIRMTNQLSLTLDYRYLASPNVKYDYGTGCFPNGTGCISRGNLEQDYTSQAVTVGLRWAF
jgi:opacity protein-like surface antigen